MASGKRAGARQKQKPRPVLLALALGVTGSVVAWGYLVYAAIDFGSSARDGESAAWAYLALASVGAVACLFLGLILLARISRALGITRPPPPRGHDQHVEDDVPHDPGTPPASRHSSR